MMSSIPVMKISVMSMFLMMRRVLIWNSSNDNVSTSTDLDKGFSSASQPTKGDSQSDTDEVESLISPLKEDTCRGYTLVWDNVGKVLKARHQNTGRQNKVMLWALAYAAKNRIQTLQLSNDCDVLKAQDIPVEAFLPSTEELEGIQTRMGTIVGRILCTYMPWVSTHFKAVTHIPNKFSKESSKKSEIINLGVFQENPATLSGTIEILKHLHQYVPKKDGTLKTILCYGDGLSCERHHDAHRAKMNEPNRTKRLLGLEPAPQEFHKRMILMQDIMDVFFDGSSQNQWGTLSHIRDMFYHRNVKTDVGESFNATADFMHFVTSGFVLLAAMNILGQDKLDSPPENGPEDVDGMDDNTKKKWLAGLCMKVVRLVWQDVKPDLVISSGDQDDQYELCCCRTDVGGPMIECSGKKCPNKRYQLDCVEMEEEDVPEGSWYCSPSCAPDKEYKYCICRKYFPGSTMIGCDNELCPRGSWFHLTCVSLHDVPADDWYCSENCRAQSKDSPVVPEDHMFNCISSLTWCGLMDQTRKDAVRANDGPAMLSHWRHDVILVHNRNHSKYVILAHRLLAGVAGWLPARLREDVIWNRTVNLTGIRDRNIEIDLVNEFLNRDFKDSLKDARGNITEETVARHSQVVGTLSTEIDGIYSTLTGSHTPSASKRQKEKLSRQDLVTFTRIFRDHDFFNRTPGREFPAFPKFRFQCSSKNPSRLKFKLASLSKRLDSFRRKVGPLQ